jgi:8-oxo-dGTP pyrophosphatase MutT (NUDIX family)
MRRFKGGQEYYALPGGKVEPGETPRQTCIRETREETGLEAADLRELCSFTNQGRMEHYFLPGRWSGTPRLGGPELGRQGPDNRYALEWVQAERLAEIDLRPSRIRGICVEAAGKLGKRKR